MLRVVRYAALAAIVGAVTVTAMPSAVDAQMGKDAIDARRALMKTTGKNMKVLGGFMKKGVGTASDVAKSARIIAASIAELPNHYPNGTAQGSGAGNTRAKAEIWTQWAKFTQAGADASAAALKMAMAADTGDKGAMGGAMGALGKACGACHKPFRGPKN